MNNNRDQIISYKEFLERNNRPVVRPCAWKWEDILSEMNNDSWGVVSLVNKDVEDYGATSPTMNVLVQKLEAGQEEMHSHRHSNMALNFVVEGEGYSMIDGEKFEWKKGDFVLAPAWSDHGHINTSETEEAIIITFQDVPQLSNMGTWFFEDTTGDTPRHVAKEREENDSK